MIGKTIPWRVQAILALLITLLHAGPLAQAEEAVDSEGPLTLDACVRIALERNPSEQAARSQVVAAGESVGEARAPYYPEIGVGAGYRRFETHAFLPEGVVELPDAPTTVGPTDDWLGNLRAAYTLYDHGERRARVDEAEAEQAVASEEASQTRRGIVLAVHREFYGVVAALEARSVADGNLTRAEDHLRLARERKEAGAVPLADVLRARVEVADARLALVEAENLVRVSRGRLNTVMGLPVETPTEVHPTTAEIPSPEERQVEDALEHALRARPELRAADQRVEAAASVADVARSAFGPRVDAEARFGWRDEEFLPEDLDWSVGVTVRFPLFTGFSRKHGLRKAEAEFARERADASRTALAVKQEVWEARSNVERAYEAVGAAEVLVEDARESLRSTRERYEVGAGTITDLLDAQTALARAEARHVQAVWEYNVADAEFDWATGDL